MSQVILCGHSFGGYLALHLANRMTFGSLILISPVGLLPTLGSWGMYWAWIFKLSLPNIGRFFGVTGALAASKSLSDEDYYSHLVSSHPRGLGHRLVQELIYADHKSAYWSKPVFASHVPTLFIYGSEDTIIPSHQGLLARFLYGHEVLVVHGAGHNPMCAKNGPKISEKMRKWIRSEKSVVKSSSVIEVIPWKYRSTWSLNETDEVIRQLYRQIICSHTSLQDR
jgi:pimeloyl-ACP methyl ester carboxylesterase